MATERSAWQAFTPEEAKNGPPEFHKAVARARQREPIVTVTLEIYSTRRGDSTLTLMPSDRGRTISLSAAFPSVILRELQEALAALTSTD
jgi:hypothetical protein